MCVLAYRNIILEIKVTSIKESSRFHYLHQLSTTFKFIAAVLFQMEAEQKIHFQKIHLWVKILEIRNLAMNGHETSPRPEIFFELTTPTEGVPLFYTILYSIAKHGSEKPHAKFCTSEASNASTFRFGNF